MSRTPQLRTDGVLVDTNVLLLLLVGSVDIRYIRQHKRTAKYDSDALTTAQTFIARFRSVLTTPHVLAETANILVGGMRDQAVLQLWEAFRIVCRQFDERHSPAHVLSRDTALHRLELTDIGIIRMARRGWVVLTDDLDLFIELQSRNLQAVNFTNLRFPDS